MLSLDFAQLIQDPTNPAEFIWSASKKTFVEENRDSLQK
jgi:hypothetical protein